MDKNATRQRHFTYHFSALLFGLILTAMSLASHAESELPTIGNTSSSLVSIEQEKILGEAWLRSLRRQVDTYHNPIVEEYFSNLVYQLAPNSAVLDREFRLVILKSSTLNAFAVPGSVVGINAGLFIHASREQEFASVIAHELAHLSQRHYARRLEQQQRSQPLNLAGFLASAIILATAGSEAGLATLASTQALSVDQQLRYSRQNEQEADRIGIETMYRSGFDPRAMPALFAQMMRNNRLQGNNLPEYLSTHPLSENRVADTKNRAELYTPKRYKDSLDYHIARNIILVDFSESPTKAASIFSSTLEKQNTLELPAIRFGLAYALINTDPQRSTQIFNKLLEKHPDLISAHIYRAKSKHKEGQSADAIKDLKSLLKRNPDNYPIQEMLAWLYLETNEIGESESIYKQLSRTQVENPHIWYNLAELHGLAGNIVALHQARAEYFYLHNRLDESIKQLKLARKKNPSAQQNALIEQRIDEIYKLKRNPPL